VTEELTTEECRIADCTNNDEGKPACGQCITCRCYTLTAERDRYREAARSASRWMSVDEWEEFVSEYPVAALPEPEDRAEVHEANRLAARAAGTAVPVAWVLRNAQ
jgi:hypothetical protein